MNKEELESSIQKIAECDFIRYEKDGEKVVLFLVGDEDHEHHENEEEEEGCCCAGLNGHLFRIEFSGIKDFSVEGEEADSYVYGKTTLTSSSVFLALKGHSFFGNNSTLTLSFTYSSYQVIDLGEIESPEV